MRPPEFTGGNPLPPCGLRQALVQRFNEAAGIHRRKPLRRHLADTVFAVASMRPPEFTGGNGTILHYGTREVIVASMRPPEFTGGNPIPAAYSRTAHSASFNEAAGIHRRKRRSEARQAKRSSRASMRPPEFTGGNTNIVETRFSASICFNEAAGIHRRKQGLDAQPPRIPDRFNEAAGIHRRKPVTWRTRHTKAGLRLQ